MLATLVGCAGSEKSTKRGPAGALHRAIYQLPIQDNYKTNSMKKILKITGITMVILALVLNLYSTLFTFYGIKSNKLPGQVWAQSTSTSTSGTSSDGIFYEATTSGCYVTNLTIVPVTTYVSGGGTASIGFTGNTVTSVNMGGTGSSSSNNQYIAIYTPGQQVTCSLQLFASCDAQNCSYAPGTKAAYVIVNGKVVYSSSSTSN